MDKLDISQDSLSESRGRINKIFEDLSGEQDALSAKNCVIDVNGSDIMYINAGGGSWCTWLGITWPILRGIDWRFCSAGIVTNFFQGMAMGVFLEVVDYLVNSKIAHPNILLEIKRVGGEE